MTIKFTNVYKNYAVTGGTIDGDKYVYKIEHEAGGVPEQVFIARERNLELWDQLFGVQG